MQFRILGTGTTALQDGSLPGLEAALSFHVDGVLAPRGSGWEQGAPQELAGESKSRWFSEAMTAPGCG